MAADNLPLLRSVVGLHESAMKIASVYIYTIQAISSSYQYMTSSTKYSDDDKNRTTTTNKKYYHKQKLLPQPRLRTTIPTVSTFDVHDSQVLVPSTRPMLRPMLFKRVFAAPFCWVHIIFFLLKRQWQTGKILKRS